jgi:DNA topoisomerase-1
MPRLRTAQLAKPGLGRRRSGRGFRLLDEHGQPLGDTADRRRIQALAIPPAWTDVWIAPQANAHIQAVGTDAAGRRQYIYHAQWSRKQAELKYDRALELAERLPQARARVTRDLRGKPATRERALAVAFRLLDSAHLRVGSEQYALQHGSRGLSTLDCSDATVHGDTVVLGFAGKGAIEWGSETTDAELAAAVRSLKRRGPGERLLAWNDAGLWKALHADEVNDYVRETTKGDFTAKDFRTLHGTIAAATSLASSAGAKSARSQQRAMREAVTLTAELLGNTATIAKASYIDPRVFDRFRDGQTMQTRGISPESAIRLLILGPES